MIDDNDPFALDERLLGKPQKNHTIPHYTLAQLQTIIRSLQHIVIDSNAVFRVSVINGGTDKPIALSSIQGSGIVYLKIVHGDEVRTFSVWVEVKE